MITHPLHSDAASDHFPQLVRDLIAEHGSDGIAVVVEQVIAAELGDICWESRIAEKSFGPIEQSLDADGAMPCERVAILGYFRGRYHVATCLVDADRRLVAMLRLRYFDGYDAAGSAFAAAA